MRPTHLTLAAVAAALAWMGTPGPALAQTNWTGNLNLMGGFKFLESDWKPAEDQRAFGIQGDVRLDTWPINLVAAYTFAESASESVEIPAGGTVTNESRTDEVDLGIRKYFERETAWRPFVSGGVSLLRGELETKGPLISQDDSDTAVGLWAGLGTLYVWGDVFNTGVQAKYATGNVDLNGQSLDAGGIHVSALLGVRW